MKRLKDWHNSNDEFDVYMPYPGQVDIAMFNYFAEIIAPACHHTIREGTITYLQVGEPWLHEDSSGKVVGYFSTFMRKEDKYFFLGKLPAFEHLNTYDE